MTNVELLKNIVNNFHDEQFYNAKINSIEISEDGEDWDMYYNEEADGDYYHAPADIVLFLADDIAEFGEREVERFGYSEEEDCWELVGEPIEDYDDEYEEDYEEDNHVDVKETIKDKFDEIFDEDEADAIWDYSDGDTDSFVDVLVHRLKDEYNYYEDDIEELLEYENYDLIKEVTHDIIYGSESLDDYESRYDDEDDEEGPYYNRVIDGYSIIDIDTEEEVDDVPEFVKMQMREEYGDDDYDYEEEDLY